MYTVAQIPTACNYDATATQDDGSCAVNDECGVCGGDNSTCGGCTDPAACNYDPAAVIDDGSCIVGGEDLTVTILTDNYPGETTWTVTDAAGTVVASGGPYDATATEYVQQVCVDAELVTHYDQRFLRRWHLLCLWNGGVHLDFKWEQIWLQAENSRPPFRKPSVWVKDLVAAPTLTACNYDPNAITDDGSCETRQALVAPILRLATTMPPPPLTMVLACRLMSVGFAEETTALASVAPTLRRATTIQPPSSMMALAYLDECGVCGGDNSTCGGCTDPAACNYDASAIVDDGSVHCTRSRLRGVPPVTTP